MNNKKKNIIVKIKKQTANTLMEYTKNAGLNKSEFLDMLLATSEVQDTNLALLRIHDYINYISDYQTVEQSEETLRKAIAYFILRCEDIGNITFEQVINEIKPIYGAMKKNIQDNTMRK